MAENDSFLNAATTPELRNESTGLSPTHRILSKSMSAQHPSSNLYRPDVDGLRAFAVVAVFIFHLHRRWLNSGFVGVDVFFVVSGYVVSHSIAGRDSGTLGRQLQDFYARRVKRLLPGLLLSCLVVSLAFAALTTPFPDALNDSNCRTALTAFGGVSNIYMVRGRSYFDTDAIPYPFTHTWSLGVGGAILPCFSGPRLSSPLQ